MAAARLSWLTPPTLACDLVGLGVKLRESLLLSQGPMRQRIGVWFRHMLALGFVSEEELIATLGGVRPLTGLLSLSTTSCSRWIESLNALLREQACGQSEDYENCLEVTTNLWSAGDESEAVLTLGLSGYLGFSVDSLHREPPELAAAVYEGLELVSCCLLPCMMPAGMWDGSDIGWLGEELREEYTRLCMAGARENLQAGIKLIETGEFVHFSATPGALAAELESAHEQFDGRPAWMRPLEGTRRIEQVRGLQETVERLRARHGEHPWWRYVNDVCTVLLARFPRECTLSDYRVSLKRAGLECDENEVPLYLGLWMDSGSEYERQNAQALFQGMGENSEFPTQHYALSTLAPTCLQQILDNTAIALGLMLRAHATNKHAISERQTA
ncbi:MAG: hypothetical protein ACJ8R9_05665 [Steroidobacteraceae bacterium]